VRNRTGERACSGPSELPLDADGEAGDVVLAGLADRVEHAVEDVVGRRVLQPGERPSRRGGALVDVLAGAAALDEPSV
jgi:hypothetical protein